MILHEMTEQIRTFVAIPLPAAVIEELGKLVSRIKPLAGNVKWVRPQSIHLTLKFLGNLSPEGLARVFAGMNLAFNPAPPVFKLQTGGVGTFPNPRRPRVLWVGVNEGGTGALIGLQKAIESALADQGFVREDRKFSPHLTMARIKVPGGLEKMMEVFTAYSFPAIEFPVREVHVMRSDLKPEGAIYTVQKTYYLK